MIRLVTLAHRAAGVHKRYSSVHSSVFSLGLPRLRKIFRPGRKTDHCGYAKELRLLIAELEEIRAIVHSDEELQPATTLGREFTAALDEYIVALTATMEQLNAICGSICRERQGLERYGDRQSRADRQEYDQSVQQYRRLGERLNFLFTRL